MDKLTKASVENCVKELDALARLVASGEFPHSVVADWIEEVSWNLHLVFRRRHYNSDEFRHRLGKLD